MRFVFLLQGLLLQVSRKADGIPAASISKQELESMLDSAGKSAARQHSKTLSLGAAAALHTLLSLAISGAYGSPALVIWFHFRRYTFPSSPLYVQVCLSSHARAYAALHTLLALAISGANGSPAFA